MPTILDRIRTSDDQTKKRWLWGLSAVMMFVVIWIWLGYFNSLFMHSGEAESEFSDSFSFWDSVKGSGSAAWSGLTASIRDVGKSIGRPKEYIIQPQ